MKVLRDAPQRAAADSNERFPLEALPYWARPFVEAVASATQTPLELAAMVTLSVLSAACAKTAQVSPAEGHVEPLNLYTLTTLESGARKSAVLGLLAEPLCDFQARKAVELADAIRDRTVERALSTRKHQLALNEGNLPKAQEHAKHLSELPPLYVPRLYADDSTPEKLVGLMAEQHGRMAVLTAEGVLIEHMRGLYQGKGSANLTVFLKAHSGESLVVDRMNRTEVVHRPALTLGLAVQPEVLRRLFDVPGAEGFGLLARMLYCVPCDFVGFRDVNPPPVPPEARRRYHEQMARLLALEPSDAPPTLTFTPKATALFHAFARELEPRLRTGTGDLSEPFLRSWASKLAGALARIAGLLHVAEHGPHGEVTEATVERALRLGPFLIEHVRLARNLAPATAVPSLQARVLARIMEWDAPSFSRSDLQSKLGGSRAPTEALSSVLSELEERGYVRRVPVERLPGTVGRPPSPRYEVTPSLFNVMGAGRRPSVRSSPGFADSANPLSSPGGAFGHERSSSGPPPASTAPAHAEPSPTPKETDDDN